MIAVRPKLIFCVVWAAAIVAVALLHAYLYRTFVPDDTWISLHYARRLLEGHGLTWVSGERVEGYSNPLFVLLCAAGGGLGFALLDVARAIGVMGFLATVLAVGFAFRPWNRAELRLASAVGMLVVSVSGAMAAWSMGGLETTLFSAWVTWAAVLLVPEDGPPRPAQAGVLLAIATLTRADGYLFTGIFAIGLVVGIQSPFRKRLRSALVLAIAPTVALALQTGFRLVYFGDYLPNTARAKVAVSTFTLHAGLVYLLDAAGVLFPMAVAAMASGILLRRSQRVRFVACVVVAWLGYVVLVGGDWMPAHRYIVPVLPMIAWLASMLLAQQWSFPETTRRVAVLVVTLVLLFFHVTLQRVAPANREASGGSAWVWQCGELAARLGKALAKDDPLLAADVAGCWPYFSRFRTIDMLGLADRHIARQRREVAIHSVPGHALGDGHYVLDQQPDLISFAGVGSRAPVYLSGVQMLEDPRFGARYRPVRFAAGQGSAWLWIRKDGGPLSTRIESDHIAVPALQLAGPDCIVRSLGTAELATTCLGPVLVEGLLLRGGHWRVEIDCEGAPVLRLRATLGDVDESVGASGLVLKLDSPRRVTLSVSAFQDGSLAIRQVRLDRLAD